MDEGLIIDIVRYMQWSGDDALDLWPEIDGKRPTAYWIYQKICAEESRKKKPSKNSVFEHYEYVLKCLSPRFIIDPSLFSCSMTSLIFSDDLFLTDEQYKQIQETPNVEEVQRGIGLWQHGLFPTLAVNVLYKKEDELEQAIKRITGISNAINLFYRVKSFEFSLKSACDPSSLICKDGKLRTTVRKIIEELVESPHIPLNELSKNIGISRDIVYRDYANITKSGLFKIEYSVVNPIIAGLSFLQLGFLIENNQKKEFIAKLKKLPMFMDRLLLSRWNLNNIIYTLFWAKDYVDFLNIHSSIMRYIGDDIMMFSVWQPRSYLNKGLWLKMINP
ncbi:MAG: hypothetical protein ACYCR7_07535 [Thermoplasmataceae archaeon]